jgi:hypothetical protein
MKKKIISSLGIIFLFLLLVGLFLSIKGYETDKFNNKIQNEITKIQPNIKLELTKIKIKFNPKKLNIFLTTKNPKISYLDINLPIKKFDIYIDLISLIKLKLKIQYVNLKTNKIDVNDIKKLIARNKPSNFKSFLINNVTRGEVEGDLNIEFKEDFEVKDYKLNAIGNKVNIDFNKLKFKNLSFGIRADNDFIYIKEVKTNLNGIPITDGVLEINKKKDLLIDGSFKATPKINNKFIDSILVHFNKKNYIKETLLINGNIFSNFKLKFSNSLELLDYNYNFSGTVDNSNIKLKNKIKLDLLSNEISQIFLDKANFKGLFNKNEKKFFNIEGLYKFDEEKFEKFKYDLEVNDKTKKNKLTINFMPAINLSFLNYNKKAGITANMTSEFQISKDSIDISKFEYAENKSTISLKDISLDKNFQLKKISNILIKTFKNKKENNNFKIVFSDKIFINGNKYDATNLIRQINKKSKNSFLKKINKRLEIKLDTIITTYPEPLNGFSLFGQIKKGKLVKILSKSEFSNNKFLDIILKKDQNTNKKLLEVYSDLPEPILSNYDFFKGLEGGDLSYISTFDEDQSSSNLVINNFKVKKAPGFAKLLSLADFGGMTDLLSGNGLSFDALEIKIKNDDKVLKIEELYAVGPSISIILQGYVDNQTGLVSLRGTMVPAKTLNKLISKIPVLGNILIPKEVGEGLFGVSFKMKGPPGKIKTSVNPIKTITPRFITKALEKRKKTK